MLCEPWVTGEEVLSSRPDKIPDGTDAALVDTAALTASEVCYALSGSKFPGRCRVTVRPAARRIGWTVTDWNTYLLSLGGSGYTGSWGYCRGGDHGSCLDRAAIDLGLYPLQSIDAVVIGGATLDPAAYKVEADRLLVRVDGSGWPTCQDPADPGGFSVTAVYGAAPPQAGIDAATALTVELAIARGGGASKLPARVTSVVRQGVQWTVLDPMTFLERGKTGVYEVDLFLSAFNPHGQKGRGAVLSPDLDQSRRTSPITAGGPTP